ncbi:MAG: GNAT family N-acetyltransferase [Ignavibacteriales bacterium]|nr:GNAT family N-acetyltransferase [Ignavibacteriales bacterium]
MNATQQNEAERRYPLRIPDFALRPFRSGDEEDVLRHADNPNVAGTLLDRFPSPYTIEDARAWIDFASSRPDVYFAITRLDRVVGAISGEPGEDVFRESAEIGYWIGEEWRGRGVVPAAVERIVGILFRRGFRKCWADVFGGNAASARVLEKCGFQREGVRRAHVVKNGAVLDLVLYGLLREEWEDSGNE